MDIGEAKREVREATWSRLEETGQAVPPGTKGRIPNFIGAERAAERLARHDAWRNASVIKSNPDKTQLPVRLRALVDGRLLYMAVPKIADIRHSYLLDPANLNAAPANIATGSDAADHAPKVGVSEMRPVDLVVCGSVAVNRDAVRIGKGAGYSDIEVGLLTEAGLVGPATILATGNAQHEHCRPSLIVIDVQSGFINDQSRPVIPKVVELVERWEVRTTPLVSPATAITLLRPPTPKASGSAVHPAVSLRLEISRLLGPRPCPLPGSLRSPSRTRCTRSTGCRDRSGLR